MPYEWLPPDPDHVIQRYNSGESTRELAASLNICKGTLRKFLKKHGVAIRPPSGIPKAIIDINRAIALYESGMSARTVGAEFSVGAGVIYSRFREAGYSLRSGSDARRLMNANLSRNERMARTEAAHAASRGRRKPAQALNAGAIAREVSGAFGSPDEESLWLMLNERGEQATPQRAFRRYSIDLATPPVAIEIASSDRLAYGTSRTRNQRKIASLLRGGWHVVVVWTALSGGKNRDPLTTAAADYLVSFLNVTRQNPTMIREYRVISGSGKEIAVSRLDVDHIAFKPPTKAQLGI